MLWFETGDVLLAPTDRDARCLHVNHFGSAVEKGCMAMQWPALWRRDAWLCSGQRCGEGMHGQRCREGMLGQWPALWRRVHGQWPALWRRDAWPALWRRDAWPTLWRKDAWPALWRKDAWPALWRRDAWPVASAVEKGCMAIAV